MILGVLLSFNLAWAQNKVLELDGNGSYVELPPNIFANLTQATVEVWAKWDSFRNFSRIFEFGAPWQSMSLFNHQRNSDLRFNLYPQNAKENRSLICTVRVSGLLRANEWIHLAAVSGPGGMMLYANGILVGQHTNTASFADIQVSQTNLFGRGMARAPGDEDFCGQMDEIRVWNHRRTEAQIRENMRRRLTGREDGLVGLWNFEDGTANDSSPSNFRGKFIGNARVVLADAQANGQLLAAEPLRETAQPSLSSLPAKATPNLAAAGRDPATWWIAGVLTLIVGLLIWLVMTLRRSGTGPASQLLPASEQARLTAGVAFPASADLTADQQVKERALAELTAFAKESLVQGLYSQRNALLEMQQKAQWQLAELEARLGALCLPERIAGYEKRITELEKELETRGGEVRQLTDATLLLLRRKLAEERRLEGVKDRFN